MTLSKEPSIQDVVGLFLSKFGRVGINKELFVVRAKAAILLLRWLGWEKVIKITKVSLYSSYHITFVNQEYEEIFIEAYYSKRIFFRESDSNKTDAVGILERTPIALNEEYLAWLDNLVDSIEREVADRVKFGFSPNATSFKGELLTVKEGLRHYKYIKKVLDNQKITKFYMYRLDYINLFGAIDEDNLMRVLKPRFYYKYLNKGGFII